MFVISMSVFIFILMKYFYFVIFVVLFPVAFGKSRNCIDVPLLVKDSFINSKNLLLKVDLKIQKRYYNNLKIAYESDTLLRNANTYSNDFIYKDSINQLFVRKLFSDYVGYEVFGNEKNKVLDYTRLLLNHLMGYSNIKSIENSIKESINKKNASSKDLLIFYIEYCWNRIYKSKQYQSNLPIIDDIGLLSNSVSRFVLAKNIDFFTKHGYEYCYVPSQSQIKDFTESYVYRVFYEMHRLGVTKMPNYNLLKEIYGINNPRDYIKDKPYLFLFSKSSKKDFFPLLDVEICE